MPLHKINRVTLDFSFPEEEKEEALQKSRSLFYDKALKQLNTLFETVDDHIYIDRFEINMSQTSMKNFEADFSDELAKTFGKHIAKAEKTMVDKDQWGADSYTDCFFFFLSNGYWPWNYQQKTNDEILALITHLFKDEQGAPEVFKRVQLKGSVAAERLVNVAGASRRLWKLFFNALLKYHPLLLSLQDAFATSRAGNAAKPGSFIFYLTVELLVSPPVNSIHKLLGVLQKITNNNFFNNYGVSRMQGVQPVTEKTQQSREMNSTHTDLELMRAFISEAADLPAGKTVSANLPHTYNTMHGIQDNTQPGTELQKISIQNAGLVLFHPYLVYAFAELNWLTPGKQFKNGKLQQKAVMFLQYLVNGKSRQAEHGLVLNKLLCGWPVHLPLKIACNFSAAEKAVAANLIESLKEHWAVVKTTSAAGIISSFVSRSGLIQKTENGYTLQVERKTIDILMDSLPFGISIIKLPWNEHIISTEW